MAKRYSWWVLCGFAVAAWSGLPWLAKSEGNSEEVFSRIQLGMSQHEVVELLDTLEYPSGRYYSVVTTHGRSFSAFVLSMEDLPRPSEIESCVLTAPDRYGREIEVTLGPGGIVSGKRLSPGVWEHRWDKAYRQLRDIPYTVEYRWNKAYRELREKPYRVFLYKYRYIVLGLTVGLLALTVGLLVTSIRMWRAWAARRSLRAEEKGVFP